MKDLLYTNAVRHCESNVNFLNNINTADNACSPSYLIQIWHYMETGMISLITSILIENCPFLRSNIPQPRLCLYHSSWDMLESSPVIEIASAENNCSHRSSCLWGMCNICATCGSHEVLYETSCPKIFRICFVTHSSNSPDILNSSHRLDLTIGLCQYTWFD